MVLVLSQCDNYISESQDTVNRGVSDPCVRLKSSIFTFQMNFRLDY